MHNIVFAYDIHCAKRRRHAMRHWRQTADRYQNAFFETAQQQAQALQHFDDVCAMLDPRQDGAIVACTSAVQWQWGSTPWQQQQFWYWG